MEEIFFAARRVQRSATYHDKPHLAALSPCEGSAPSFADSPFLRPKTRQMGRGK
jgi:hypothetical protein